MKKKEENRNVILERREKTLWVGKKEGGSDRNRSRELVAREVYPHPFFGTYHTRTFIWTENYAEKHTR